MADPVWDERLITRTDVLERAADTQITWDARTTEQDDNRGPGQPFTCLVCQRCGRPVFDLDQMMTFTVTDISIGVLRHNVMAHEEALNARPGNGDAGATTTG